MGCWPEASLSSLLRGPIQEAACSVAAAFHHSEEVRKQERVSRTGARVILQPNLRGAAHHFARFIRSKSLGPLNTQWEGNTQGYK